jgi:hypothetical protein
MATSSTAIPTANVMVPAFMGPSQHVEEVLLGSQDVAPTLPPTLPSPDTLPMAQEAMTTSSTAVPTASQPHGGANVMATVLMGPSQHVEEVSALSQIRDNTEYECPAISNCNAEAVDERGTTELVDNTPSASKADKKDTTEVSCAPFYLFN